jgi:hypothetical protein
MLAEVHPGEPSAASHTIVIVRPHVRVVIFVCILGHAFGEGMVKRQQLQTPTTASSHTESRK